MVVTTALDVQPYETILTAIGISLPAFRIAGGMLWFLTALDMLFERRTERREGQARDEDHDPSVFPLATPLLAGPGALARGNDLPNSRLRA